MFEGTDLTVKYSANSLNSYKSFETLNLRIKIPTVTTETLIV